MYNHYIVEPGLERHTNRLYSEPYQMEMDYIPHQIMGIQFFQQYSDLLPVARADKINNWYSYLGGDNKHPFCTHAEKDWNKIIINPYLPFLKGEVVVRRILPQCLDLADLPFNKDSAEYTEAVSRAFWDATKPIDNNLHPVAIKQSGANTGMVLIPGTDEQSDGPQKLVPWLVSYPVFGINSPSSGMDHPVVLKRAGADLYNTFAEVRATLEEYSKLLHGVEFGDDFLQTPPHVVLIRKLRLDVGGAEIQQKIFE